MRSLLPVATPSILMDVTDAPAFAALCREKHVTHVMHLAYPGRGSDADVLAIADRMHGHAISKPGEPRYTRVRIALTDGRVLEGEALAVRCGAFPEDDDDRWRAADRSPVAHVRDLLRAGAFCVYETGTCARTLEGNLYVDNYDFGRRALSEDVARHEFWRVVRWPLQRWVARRVWAPGGARAKAMLAELPCDCV